eukprot:scaffold1922_cov291-Chaetoceros_neogracile.AAC.5
MSMLDIRIRHNIRICILDKCQLPDNLKAPDGDLSTSDGDRRGNGDADGDNNSIPDDADISNDPSPKISL